MAEGWTIRAFRPGAKRSISAAQLASSDAGATSRLGGSAAAFLLPLHQQQRQHLDGLAEPHVVGKAGPEPEPGQQVQPLHAGLLIGPQRARASAGPGSTPAPSGRAQRLQRLRQPGTGASPATSRRRRHRAGFGGDRRAGQHPHRLGEGQPVCARASSSASRNCCIVRSSRSRSTSTHWPRSSTSPSVPASSVWISCSRQGLAVERHLHAEIEQPVQPERRGRGARRPSP